MRLKLAPHKVRAKPKSLTQNGKDSVTALTLSEDEFAKGNCLLVGTMIITGKNTPMAT